MKKVKPRDLIPGRLYYYNQNIVLCVLRFIGIEDHRVKFTYVKGEMIYARSLDGSISFWDDGSIIFIKYVPFKYGK